MNGIPHLFLDTEPTDCLVIELDAPMINVVDLVCLEDILEEEGGLATQTVDAAVENALAEITVVRAEVEKVYQSLRGLQGTIIKTTQA